MTRFIGKGLRAKIIGSLAVIALLLSVVPASASRGDSSSSLINRGLFANRLQLQNQLTSLNAVDPFLIRTPNITLIRDARGVPFVVFNDRRVRVRITEGTLLDIVRANPGTPVRGLDDFTLSFIPEVANANLGRLNLIGNVGIRDLRLDNLRNINALDLRLNNNFRNLNALDLRLNNLRNIDVRGLRLDNSGPGSFNSGSGSSNSGRH